MEGLAAVSAESRFTIEPSSKSKERAARLKLDRLEAALTLSDLAVLPGNRFEALKGSRKGQYSIRVNDPWRVCFEWPERSPGPANVEIVDYH